MKDQQGEIRKKLSEKGLKVTPQRVAILEAIYELKNHPTAENIIEFVRKNHPNIATGTVYKVLETLTDNKLISKVTNNREVMRYDGTIRKHHHLYCNKCDRIEDYFDEEINQLLIDYFEKKKIPGFQIEEFVLQIKGISNKC